jgi:transcriptional regulator with XRE-family HTH domain
MDNRAQIREFLASRRARITPEQAGLPAYGSNRRVAGLRREEVAMLAGVSIDYYVRMERGNLAGASDAVLEGIAWALQLDDAERGHLFDLARGSEPQPARLRRISEERQIPALAAMLRHPVADQVRGHWFEPSCAPYPRDLTLQWALSPAPAITLRPRGDPTAGS